MMTMKTFSAVIVQYLRETIAPTLPVGVEQGILGAISAVIAYRPDILQTAINKVKVVSALGLVKDGLVDPHLIVSAIRGYFSSSKIYTITLFEGGPRYDVTEADADRFCTLLMSVYEAQMAENSAKTTAADGVRTPEQVLGGASTVSGLSAR